MALTEVLGLMNHDGSTLRYARADPIRSLDGFCPVCAEPSAPIAKLCRSIIAASVFYGNSIGVAKQHDVTGVLHDAIKPIELCLG